MIVIQTSNLTKYYGKTRGIQNLDLEVRQGEIFGFLGPNGAGKTTTIRLLLDLLHPTRGQASIFGLDSQRCSIEIRKRLGYIPGEVVLYDGMSGKEYLQLMASFHTKGNRRLEELQERLALDLKKQTRAYSKGMKQKLVIIQAFMHDPELYILDEPTLGLDPLMQREFFELLLEEKARGKTILLLSHILTEVERVCDRVGIVRSGELVAIEEVSALKRKKVHHLRITLSHEIPPEAIRLEGVDILSLKGRDLEVRVYGNFQRLLQELSQLPVEDFSSPEASLEDTFMRFYDKEQA